MMEKIQTAIEAALAAGTPPQLLADQLTSQGWPASMVNTALQTYFAAHAQGHTHNTAFKDWLKKYHTLAKKPVAIVVGLNLFDTMIALLKP